MPPINVGTWNLLEPLFVKYFLGGVIVNTFENRVPKGSKVPKPTPAH
jgi:hypothetical protein